jgi:hypothetical protein
LSPTFEFVIAPKLAPATASVALFELIIAPKLAPRAGHPASVANL